MRNDVCRAAGAVLLAAAWLSTARAEQAVRLSEVTGDGALRSELSLVGRTATLGVTPGLKVGGAEHQRVTGVAGDTARARIGYLHTNGVLQFGSVPVGKLDQAGIRFDLDLIHGASGWQLLAAPAPIAAPPSSRTAPPSSGGAAEAPAPPAAATIALASKSGTRSATTALTAVWVPSGRDTAQLVLNWGDLRLTADVQFVEPKIPRPANAARQAPPTKRSHDEPNRGARQLMLSQLNETAVVLPGGARLSVTFARSFPRGQRTVSAAATLSRAGLGVDGPDFQRLMATPNGAVVELSESPVPRLLVGAPVRFGKLTARPGNQTPGYSGAYGLWLKRAGSGWRLVFNSESDVWGTQYDGKYDVGEVELTHAENGDPSRPFAIALVPAGTDGGRLIVSWGAHEWSADYVMAN